MSSLNLLTSHFNKKEQAELRRQVLGDLAERKLKARCTSIFRNQIAKADKLQILRPDYDAGRLMSMARTVVGTPCRYCGKKITVSNMSFDHKFPLDRGGTMTTENLDVIDDSCNNKKGKLTAGEFQSLIMFLKSFAEEARGDVLTRLGIGGRWKH